MRTHAHNECTMYKYMFQEFMSLPECAGTIPFAVMDIGNKITLGGLTFRSYYDNRYLLSIMCYDEYSLILGAISHVHM